MLLACLPRFQYLVHKQYYQFLWSHLLLIFHHQPKAAQKKKKELITHVELEEKKLTVDDANNVDDLKEVMNNIANSKIDSLSLELLLKKIQKKYKLLVGESPSLPALKKIIKANKVQRKK